LITCQLHLVAPINDLPGIVPGFSYALGIGLEEAFDILADASKLDRLVFATMTDAAFGRLLSNCNSGQIDGEIIQDYRDVLNMGWDIGIEVLHTEADQHLVGLHVVLS
jgi:hypothetical protein